MSHFLRETAQKYILFVFLSLFPNFVLGQSSSLEQFIQKRVREMSLDEKVGQLFIVGFPQKTFDSDLERFLVKNKPGSYLLFKRNVASLEQLKLLTEQLYKVSYRSTRLPPFIAIDQEGGSVSRLPIFPTPPNALAIGKTSSPQIAKEMGFRMGLFLREVGVNMNLAPVLDLADPFQFSFIGARAFGSDPELVGLLGTAYSQGLIDAHVIPTAKHFPGSGDSALDPHVTVVASKKSADELRKVDMRPFVEYSRLGPQSAMMMSHLIYPTLDPESEPASFSRQIASEILRKQIGYTGLVMTDDLQMQGSRKLLRPEKAALKALQSGADIVMLTWSFADQERAIQFVKGAVEKGDLKLEELNQKIERILRAKAFANSYRRNPDLPSLISGNVLASQEYDKLEKSILEANLQQQLAEAQGQSVERRPASVNTRVCAASSNLSFLEQLRQGSTLQVETREYERNHSRKKFLSWLEEQKCEVLIFAVTGKSSAQFVERLPAAKKERMILLNLGAPYLVNSASSYFQLIQLYFNHQDAGKSFARILPDILSQKLAANSHQ